MPESCSEAAAYITRPGEPVSAPHRPDTEKERSFLHQLSSAHFPTTYSQPPRESNVGAAERPALAVQLGGINLSVGGTAGTGVYRTGSNEPVGVQTDGIRDGVKEIFNKVRQGVERLNQP